MSDLYTQIDMLRKERDEARAQRDELLAALERVTDLLNDPGVGDFEQWKRDCREWTARAGAAIGKARGATIATEAVRVPSENLGDLTGTKFGERLAKHAAKKARGK